MQWIFINLLKKLAVFAGILIFLHVFISNNVVYNAVLIITGIYLTDVVFNIVWHVLPKEMLPNLNEKAVFVTGCDSGFGNGLARKLDELGVMVFAGCLFPDGDGAVQLKESCSDRLKIVQLDVTKHDQIQKALEVVTSTLQDRSEKLWAVVNNAGIASGSEVEWTPMEEYEKIISVNATGPFKVTQAFLPLLRKSKGRVVIVTSIYGCMFYPGLSVYCMSKAAAVALVDALRRELCKWSVSVHAVQPWLYRTNITATKGVVAAIVRNWEATPKSVREAYGDGYIDKYSVLGGKVMEVMSRPESAVHEVVDSLTHAAIGKNPKSCYVPGVVGLILSKVLTDSSSEIFDIVASVIQEKPTIQ